MLGNIFASYDIPTLVALAAALAGALAFALGRVPAATFDDWSVRDRARALGITALLAVGVGVGWRLDPVSVAASRVDDEIAQNGWVQLLAAFRTAHLDYEAYYALVPSQDANARVARLVGLPESSTGLVHSFAAHRPAPPRPLDVVVIIEESLGSSFSARFGHTEDDPVTPALDRWSGQGLALTNLVATGNRTVRGLEAVLCSFLPLPGDAVIKRDRSENIATIARVLAARGYATTFMYGGYGLFDNLKPFMLRNGFPAFVEQPQYPPDAFRTIWGVADEYVFDAMIAAQEEADRAGRPSFGTALTVSNHKPFDVPPGRVASPEGRSARRKAVLYADWALDRYLTQARREGLLAHTVLLVVGDHGARVYGAEQIPAESYRIPAFFLTPAAADRGTVIDRVASQVDLCADAALAGRHQLRGAVLRARPARPARRGRPRVRQPQPRRRAAHRHLARGARPAATDLLCAGGASQRPVRTRRAADGRNGGDCRRRQGGVPDGLSALPGACQREPEIFHLAMTQRTSGDRMRFIGLA